MSPGHIRIGIMENIYLNYIKVFGWDQHRNRGNFRHTRRDVKLASFNHRPHQV
jgi:hypothetical protein